MSDSASTSINFELNLSVVFHQKQVWILHIHVLKIGREERRKRDPIPYFPSIQDVVFSIFAEHSTRTNRLQQIKQNEYTL